MSFWKQTFLICLLVLHTPLLRAEERIKHFESTIHVLLDGSLRVHEKITVNAEGNQINRGIFRDFPQTYKNKLGLKKTQPFHVVEVLRNGSRENYNIEKLGSGVRVKIGSASRFLEHKEHIFELVYETDDHLLYFDKYDELYWNVTGNYWEFPIDKVTAKVVLPDGFTVLAIDAYTGYKGSSDQNAETQFVDHTAEAIAGDFDVSGGLTISVVWPPGLLNASVYGKQTLW